MKKNIFKECLRIALRKIEAHPQFRHYIHYSFIIQDNKIIEDGTNMEGVPPKHFGYHEKIVNGLPKLHSEYVCYRRAKGLLNPNKSFECINIRLSKQKELRMSCPCHCCAGFLASLGCSTCHFSTESGWAKLCL